MISDSLTYKGELHFRNNKIWYSAVLKLYCDYSTKSYLISMHTLEQNITMYYPPNKKLFIFKQEIYLGTFILGTFIPTAFHLQIILLL